MSNRTKRRTSRTGNAEANRLRRVVANGRKLGRQGYLTAADRDAGWSIDPSLCRSAALGIDAMPAALTDDERAFRIGVRAGLLERAEAWRQDNLKATRARIGADRCAR